MTDSDFFFLLAAKAIDAKCRTGDSYTWLRSSHLLLEHGEESESVSWFVGLLTTSTSTREEDDLTLLTALKEE